MDQSHEIETKSFPGLKLRPSEYFSHDVFYHVVERNLNWCGETISNAVNIDSMISGVRYVVHTKRGTTTDRQNLDMSVALTLKIKRILDGRLQELSSFLNGGWHLLYSMVEISLSSIASIGKTAKFKSLDEVL
ncbi:hypothetical protein RND71_009202 [Anisodus tanguticus]|uniref:Uncharacterized protein n=1 Tax=Anisodus tanguticus TaxID=243964 RepID=A0AAE1VHY8_9SOLA|nr:hypothetical protein RND71_009202 [Anisodus tanguticus]